MIKLPRVTARLFSLTFIALLLSGCSLFQGPSTVPDSDWAFNGKMAVRNSEQASSFNVDWLQQGSFFQIELSGPLGQGAITIKGNSDGVTLQRGDTVISAPTLQALAYQQTELDLPLDHLQYWVRALPDPAYAHRLTLNSEGRTAEILQAQWHVSITEYQPEPNTSLPRKLGFARAEDSGKLIIREWTKVPESTDN